MGDCRSEALQFFLLLRHFSLQGRLLHRVFDAALDRFCPNSLLGDVVRRAKLYCFACDHFVTVTSHHNNWHKRISLAQSVDAVQAVVPWHNIIDEGAIERRLSAGDHRFFKAYRLYAFAVKPSLLQSTSKLFAITLIIID